MSNKIRLNFQDIAEQVDNLIDLVNDKKMIDDYPTTDLLSLVEEEFDSITLTLASLPDIDIHACR